MKTLTLALAMTLISQASFAAVKLVQPNTDLSTLNIVSQSQVYFENVDTELTVAKDAADNTYIVLNDDLAYAFADGNEGAARDVAIFVGSWVVTKVLDTGFDKGGEAIHEHNQQVEKERVEKEQKEQVQKEREQKEAADKAVVDKATSNNGACDKNND